MPRLLEPAGEPGLSFMELGARLACTAARPVALATGEAGDVYLCHPFLVHAAQVHRGTGRASSPSPASHRSGDLVLDRPDGDHSPVEQAVRTGLGLAPSAA